MKFYALIIATIFLSGCSSVESKPHLTDAQIMGMNSAQLCSVNITYSDSRLLKLIEERRIDCSYSALVCENKGIKKGSKNFSKCIKETNKEYAIQQKRLENPAWANCIDRGFKNDTKAMKDCTLLWSLKKQQEEVFAVQQQEAENQKNWTQFFQQIDKMAQEDNQRAIVNKPINTNCSFYGNHASCTSY